jgi:hypothetical protein
MTYVLNILEIQQTSLFTFHIVRHWQERRIAALQALNSLPQMNFNLNPESAEVSENSCMKCQLSLYRFKMNQFSTENQVLRLSYESGFSLVYEVQLRTNTCFVLF